MSLISIFRRRRKNFALVIIDMLNYFATEGDTDYQTRFWTTADNIKRLSTACRAQRFPVIYANTQFDSVADFKRSPMSKKEPLHMIRGTPEAQVIQRLSPQARDILSVKKVNSAFYETRLEKILRSRHIDVVILVGVHTHVCVLQTAADAFYRSFDVLVPEECVTTKNLDYHRFALAHIERHFGHVTNSDELQSSILVPTKRP